MNGQPATAASADPPSPWRRFLRNAVLYAVCLAVAAFALTLYQHFKLNGQTRGAWVSLGTAAGFGFAPVRALLGELLAIESMFLHLVHGIGGLAIAGLTLGGVISGGPLINHGAMAPFAIMGAAQAIMHQDHPRNAEQAAALRRFASSLPEVARFTQAGNLSSPENARRAVEVLSDLIGKAQALGETELKSDPQFQSAWRQVTARLGVQLGLDSADQAIRRLASNPAAASSVPELERRLARARRTLDPRRA